MSLLIHQADIGRRKKRGSHFIFFVVILLALVWGVWNYGDEYYYYYIGDKNNRFEKFYLSFNKEMKKGKKASSVLAAEELRLGLEFVAKMMKKDAANPVVHFYRGEFHYLLARLQMKMSLERYIHFLTRPENFTLSRRVKNHLKYAMIAASKSLALGDDKLRADRNYFILSFSYLFLGENYSRKSFQYIKKIMDKKKIPGSTLYFEPARLCTLSAIVNNRPEYAKSCLELSPLFAQKDVKTFLSALILYKEVKYTDSLLKFEDFIKRNAANLESVSGEDNFFVYMQKEAYRIKTEIYFKQNLKKDAVNSIKQALNLDKKDLLIKKEAEKIGLK